MTNQHSSGPSFLFIAMFAGAVGLLAWALLFFLGDYAFSPAVFLALLVAFVVAIILYMGMRTPLPKPGESSSANASGSTAPTAAAATTGSAVAATAASAATTSEASPAPASLMSDPAPGAKKPAAKKPSAKKAAPKKTASKSTSSAAKATAKTAAKTDAKPARKPVAKDGKPELFKKPKGGKGDDLKMIKGVGPGLEKTLNEMGIWHFSQVAGWRKKEVEWVDDRLKFKGRIERDEWIKQAKTLAKGGTTDFAKKVKKGGVY